MSEKKRRDRRRRVMTDKNKQAARERQILRDERSNGEQLEELDRRLGVGVGALRERKRLEEGGE